MRSANNRNASKKNFDRRKPYDYDPTEDDKARQNGRKDHSGGAGDDIKWSEEGVHKSEEISNPYVECESYKHFGIVCKPPN